jgi:hypothetical protein
VVARAYLLPDFDDRAARALMAELVDGTLQVAAEGARLCVAARLGAAD